MRRPPGVGPGVLAGLAECLDEAVERRKGERIKAKGRYRDAARSTPGQVVNGKAVASSSKAVWGTAGSSFPAIPFRT